MALWIRSWKPARILRILSVTRMWSTRPRSTSRNTCRDLALYTDPRRTPRCTSLHGHTCYTWLCVNTGEAQICLFQSLRHVWTGQPEPWSSFLSVFITKNCTAHRSSPGPMDHGGAPSLETVGDSSAAEWAETPGAVFSKDDTEGCYRD